MMARRIMAARRRAVRQPLSAAITDMQYLQGANISTNERSLNLEFGAPSDDRAIYFVIAICSARAVNAVSIDGEVLPSLYSTASIASGLPATPRISVYEKLDSSMVSGTMLISFNASALVIGPAVMVVSASRQLSLHDSASGESQSSDLSISANSGIILASSASINGTAPTWAGVEEEFNYDINTTEFISMAHLLNAPNTPSYGISLSSGPFDAQLGAAISLS